MIEIIGQDLFLFLSDLDVNAICIPTNCSVENGINPMGGGCAAEAARRWKALPSHLGSFLECMPNVPCLMAKVDRSTHEMIDSYFPSDVNNPIHIWSYPTMHEIGEPANLDLVIRSAQLMVEAADIFRYQKVMMVRNGCGIGGLSWDLEVKPALSQILDDRFYIVHQDGK
jgi:hypothetical protein